MSNRQFLFNVFRPNIQECTKKARKQSVFRLFYLTGDERIELPPKVLETPIIPVDQSPTFRMSMIPQNFIHNK